MVLYDDMNKILGYLEFGTVEERINAICSLDHKESDYELSWNAFITDENFDVKCNALCHACHSVPSPKRLWAMLDFVLKRENRAIIGDAYYHAIKIVAEKILEFHKKEERE